MPFFGVEDVDSLPEAVENFDVNDICKVESETPFEMTREAQMAALGAFRSARNGSALSPIGPDQRVRCSRTPRRPPSAPPARPQALMSTHGFCTFTRDMTQGAHWSSDAALSLRPRPTGPWQKGW